MRQLIRVLALPLLGLGLAVSATGAIGDGEDAAHLASPEQYSVLLENDNVLVLKMVLEPGEADTMHSHQNETVYFQSGGTLAITGPSGKTMEVAVPDGHVMWHEAWTHQVTNIGDSTVVAIIVEENQ